MTELLGLEHVALVPLGATLSLSIHTGQTVTITGPAGSGKSSLLSVLAGQDRPGQGRVHMRGKGVVASSEGISRRTKVQSLVRPGGSLSVQAITEVLTATGLWEFRQQSYGDLTPSCAVACELVAPLLSDAEVVFIDGQLDRLDPWALSALEEFLRSQRLRGRSFVITTHRPDIIARADGVIVLRERQVRFAGSIEDLLRAGPPHMIELETTDQAGVRALVSPFEISVRPDGDSLRLEAREGQALAARLLLEGYGDVRFVVTRPPTVEEALRKL